MEIINVFISKLIFLWNYIIRCRGNQNSYLRLLGVRVGENCKIATSIWNFGSEPWLIEIGNNVSVTFGVIFLTHDGASRLFRKTIPGMNTRFGNRYAPIQILDNCFIGVNTILMPGVSIGPNSIVGAGSIVTKDVPPNSVYAGSPARFVFSLDEYISRYNKKMIPVESIDPISLRYELTRYFWGKER